MEAGENEKSSAARGAPQLGPAPRRLAVLATEKRAIRMSGIVLIIFVGIAFFLAMSVLSQVTMLVLGRDAVATVTEREPLPAAKGAQRYKLKYEYERGGRKLVDASEEEDPDGAKKPGAKVGVRAVVIGSFHRSVPAGQASAKALLCLLPFAILFDGIAVLMILGAWVLPARAKKLLTMGVAVEGHVVGVRPLEREKGTPQWTVEYRFTPSGGEALARSEIWNEPWAATLREGDPVTVVYWPGNPRRCVVYGTGDFRVVNGRGEAVPVG